MDNHPELTSDMRDPLISRIITQRNRELTSTQLLYRMRDSQVIYLGETHDNPRHHKAQLKALEMLVESGVRPAVGFEFFSREQTGWLMNYSLGKVSSLRPTRQSKRADEHLRENLGWAHRPDWDFYLPLIKLAREYELPLFGADLDQGLRVRLGRYGRSNLYTLERNQLPDSTFEMSAYRHMMREILDRSHCHHASDELLNRLYDTFLIRNETMADSILAMREDLADDRPVVMILGRGHIEFGMGVLERVRSRAPNIAQLNVGLVEGQSGGGLDYQPLPGPVIDGVRFEPPHELYWITPGRARGAGNDPCAQFKK